VKIILLLTGDIGPVELWQNIKTRFLVGFVVVAPSKIGFERRILEPFIVRYVITGFKGKKDTRYCYIIAK
jgi:hypothetical protein